MVSPDHGRIGALKHHETDTPAKGVIFTAIATVTAPTRLESRLIHCLMLSKQTSYWVVRKRRNLPCDKSCDRFDTDILNICYGSAACIIGGCRAARAHVVNDHGLQSHLLASSAILVTHSSRVAPGQQGGHGEQSIDQMQVIDRSYHLVQNRRLLWRPCGDLGRLVGAGSSSPLSKV